jgi:hypothetical protein
MYLRQEAKRSPSTGLTAETFNRKFRQTIPSRASPFSRDTDRAGKHAISYFALI